MVLVGSSSARRFFWADGMITPAISVLSAVEGLTVATPVLTPYVIPLTVALLVGLFALQRRGTGALGAVFGPLTVAWFVSITRSVFPAIARHLEVLGDQSMHAALTNGYGFLILGAVVLCVTGSEALYADMGHFGRRPIRFAWFWLVFPALLANYFGQGALLLARGHEVVANPFYALAPAWFLYPLVVIATLAAVIASQALISGAFSLAQQAIQLGFSPRMTIVHTSGEASRQISCPR
jgi:KUP system potassium uptake protein